MSEIPPNQPNLFPEDDQTEGLADVINISDYANKIGENARPFVPDDRTSEAARDQGHGPQQIIDINNIPGYDAERSKAKVSGTHPSQKKPFELPGKDGRTNSPSIVTPTEAQQGLTPDEIAEQREKNRRGVEAAREALRDATDRKNNP